MINRAIFQKILVFYVISRIYEGNTFLKICVLYKPNFFFIKNSTKNSFENKVKIFLQNLHNSLETQLN